MQQVAFYVLTKTLWKNSNLMSTHPYYVLITSFVFSIILGIVTYHLIERPIGLLLKKDLSSTSNNQNPDHYSIYSILTLFNCKALSAVLPRSPA